MSDRLAKDETPGRPGHEGFQDQAKTYATDSAAAHAKRKRESTLAARAALLGLELHCVDDGAWCVVTAHGMARMAPSLQSAEGLVAGIELVRAEVAALTRRASA